MSAKTKVLVISDKKKRTCKHCCYMSAKAKVLVILDKKKEWRIEKTSRWEKERTRKTKDGSRRCKNERATSTDRKRKTRETAAATTTTTRGIYIILQLGTRIFSKTRNQVVQKNMLSQSCPTYPDISTPYHTWLKILTGPLIPEDKTAGSVANSIDPDHTIWYLIQVCTVLLRPICLNTCTKDKYNMFFRIANTQ